MSRLLSIVFLSYLLGCASSDKSTIDDEAESTKSSDTTNSVDTSQMDTAVDNASDVETGSQDDGHLTPHFQRWLEEHPTYSPDLARLDLEGGSFGGKWQDNDIIQHRPIVFVHGNSDRALGGILNGWTDVRTYWLTQGYSSAELYATTYGPADPLYMSEYRHDANTLRHLRQFIEAVLEYTNAPKIDVIAYSLGVTLSRKVILGGGFTDASGNSIQLGAPLTDKIHTFVGIAGANQGLSSCYTAPTATCSAVDGLYPGTLFGFEVINQSSILQNINRTSGYEGSHRISVWSPTDEVLGLGGFVWGNNTAQIPEHTSEIRIENETHLNLKHRSMTEISTVISSQ